jgi:poly-gamma-glutamate synthesis protein (capsule biosynthesis protein)
MATRIGLTGDVMLGRNVDRRQRGRDAADVWGDTLDRLRALDGLFVNLECCLSTRGEPYTDTYHPFHFRADPAWAVPALETAGVDFAALANNHVLDYGEVAMADTLDALDAAGIAHSGAGPDSEAAFEPALVTVSDLDVAFVSLTDNVREWAAGSESPGVAHVRIDHEDPNVRATVRDALAEARDLDPDLLVASLHWGPNMTAGPDEARREFGRWLVEQGVDVVHGHSAHVFHGVEVVERPDGPPPGLILYDAGDFVDDYAVDDDLRNDRGFLFVLDVTAAGEVERLRLEPTEIYDYSVHRVDRSDADWWHETMRERTDRFRLGTEYERDGPALLVEP